MQAARDLVIPPIESLDDLLTLTKGHRYELHDGNLVIMAPSTYWHQDMAGRLYLMLSAAGHRVFQDPGIRGRRPRDNRLPDLGVVDALPPGRASYSNLPGSDDDALVHLYRLFPDDNPVFKCGRSLLLSELEAEFRAA